MKFFVIPFYLIHGVEVNETQCPHLAKTGCGFSTGPLRTCEDNIKLCRLFGKKAKCIFGTIDECNRFFRFYYYHVCLVSTVSLWLNTVVFELLVDF
ncbi:uncharacterized protein LOC128249943 isoform X2 [Octopus bimaculoides]|uniref:uncharacterized protein LOC128249943 isoform X2 n=1 Tax=Octopus bimaculoides TaxID=37653 RepID=UPI0022E14AF1|nr:uncharacterized protein LOC128249943 isoform X2 [Octopus bimaculoides]